MKQFLLKQLDKEIPIKKKKKLDKEILCVMGLKNKNLPRLSPTTNVLPLVQVV